MKQFTNTVLLLIGFLLYSCGGDSADTTENASAVNSPAQDAQNNNETSSYQSESTFSCKIDGELWTPTNKEFMIQATQMLSETENALAIMGIKSVEDNNNVMERFHLKLFNVAGPVEHEVQMCGLTILGGPNTSVSTAKPGSGKVNITSYNNGTKRVSGNFSFTMVNNMTKKESVVTDGEFSNVPIEQQRMQ